MDLKKEFEKHLEIAREDYPENGLKGQLTIAEDWLIEEISRQIYQISENKYWEHVEAVNKAHFE